MPADGAQVTRLARLHMKVRRAMVYSEWALVDLGPKLALREIRLLRSAVKALDKYEKGGREK